MGKVYHREFEVQKNYSRMFCYQTSLNLSISYTFQVSSHKEVIFYAKNIWKISVELFTKIVFLLSATLLNIKVCHMYLQTLWTQCSNTCYFEEQITITATEWLTPLLVIASVRSELLSGILKKVKLADIDLQHKFF